MFTGRGIENLTCPAAHLGCQRVPTAPDQSSGPRLKLGFRRENFFGVDHECHILETLPHNNINFIITLRGIPKISPPCSKLRVPMGIRAKFGPGGSAEGCTKICMLTNPLKDAISKTRAIN